MRAPDHGALRPWRFALIRDDARADFGEVLVDVAARREPATSRGDHEQRRQLAYTAPPVIVIAAAPFPNSHIPESEQLLAVRRGGHEHAQRNSRARLRRFLGDGRRCVRPPSPGRARLRAS
ncbi:nitroreductase family protein [Paraburkholderia caledonica]|uniref:hypothetical protein n=1 Tax=Paraburkholderia caledonica TaxID=134536 RepID=UPI0038BCC5C2